MYHVRQSESVIHIHMYPFLDSFLEPGCSFSPIILLGEVEIPLQTSETKNTDFLLDPPPSQGGLYAQSSRTLEFLTLIFMAYYWGCGLGECGWEAQAPFFYPIPNYDKKALWMTYWSSWGLISPSPHFWGSGFMPGEAIWEDLRLLPFPPLICSAPRETVMQRRLQIFYPWL